MLEPPRSGAKPRAAPTEAEASVRSATAIPARTRSRKGTDASGQDATAIPARTRSRNTQNALRATSILIAGFDYASCLWKPRTRNPRAELSAGKRGECEQHTDERQIHARANSLRPRMRCNPLPATS